MVAFSFQKQFAEPIITGTKRQTIRTRARAKPGDRLQLYTGMRTKACRKIGDAVCADVSTVEIRLSKDLIIVDGSSWPAPYTYNDVRLDNFARADGFADWAAMKVFFAKHHPGVEMFEGFLITWRDFTPAPILPAKSRATAAAPAAKKGGK